MAELPAGITGALWGLVLFSVLVVIRAIWFGLRDLRALLESAKNARKQLGDATAALEQDRNEMERRIASLQALTQEKDR